MNTTCRWAAMLVGYVLLAAPLGRAASDDATSHRSFADVEQWVAVFDDPARDAYQKPREVVRALRIRPGMRVADVGAGTGYFSRYLSAAVGAAGTVLAVDTEPELVRYLRERAEKALVIRGLILIHELKILPKRRSCDSENPETQL